MPDLRPSPSGDVVMRRKTVMRNIPGGSRRAFSSRRAGCRLVTLSIAALAPLYCFGQEEVDEGVQKPAQHILWIIPNFRTSPELKEYKPLAPREKFRIAVQDTFDRGTIALAGVFAAESQLSKSNPSFGEGAEGY